MDKLDQLFIRACKSQDPFKRLLTLHDRYYYRMPDRVPYINVILSKLVEKYKLVTIVNLVMDLNYENNSWRSPGGDYNAFVMRTLVKYIRFASVDQLPGLTRPAIFREKEK